jgi:hypothetical protein
MAYINSIPKKLACKTLATEPAPPPAMRGLGDLVEKVAQKTGIKAVVNKISKITGKDCGCNKRRDILNRLLPIRNR